MKIKHIIKILIVYFINQLNDKAKGISGSAFLALS